MISCTAAQGAFVTNEIYKSLLGEDTSKKVIIDLAIPADIDAKVIESNDVHYIDIESLKTSRR